MIKYLSAQPDTDYFLWQLEVQIENFQIVGIAPSAIHILVGYNPDIGINSAFRIFAKENEHKANIYFYEDTRPSRFYVPSIRPHIIKKHLAKYPGFNDTPIFYHDSDITFTRYPDFSSLLADEIWYVSDTRKYLDSSYIKAFGEEVLSDMCKVVGIKEEIVKANDVNAGGAQYIIKKSTFEFWNQVEITSESLYTHLKVNSERYAQIWSAKTDGNYNDYEQIQAWCTDMWTVFWNALISKYTVQISRLMDFAWPSYHQNAMEHYIIYHDAGVTESERNKLFQKSYFRNRKPYYVNLRFVETQSCSFSHTQLIRKVASQTKLNTDNLSIIILFDSESPNDAKILYAVLNHLSRNFTAQIIVFEINQHNVLESKKLPPKTLFKHYPLKPTEAHVTLLYNQALAQITTPFFLIYDWRIIISPEKLYEMYIKLCNNKSHFAVPFNLMHIILPQKSIQVFLKTYDITDLIDLNILDKNSAGISTKGAFMGNMEAYSKIGAENTKITGNTGLEWTERILRITNSTYILEVGDLEGYIIKTRKFKKNKQSSDNLVKILRHSS